MKWNGRQDRCSFCSVSISNSGIAGLRSGEGRPVEGIRRGGVRPHVVIVHMTDKYVENRLRCEPRNKWLAGHSPWGRNRSRLDVRKIDVGWNGSQNGGGNLVLDETWEPGWGDAARVRRNNPSFEDEIGVRLCCGRSQPTWSPTSFVVMNLFTTSTYLSAHKLTVRVIPLFVACPSRSHMDK